MLVSPCLIIILLNLSTFLLLEPSANERLLINLFCLTWCLLYQMYFAITFPKIKVKTPVVVMIYHNLMVLLTAALFFNLVCKKIMRIKSKSLPRFLTSALSGCFGKILCLCHIRKSDFEKIVQWELTRFSPDFSRLQSQFSTESDKPAPSEYAQMAYEWTLFNGALDRLIFIIFLAVYSIPLVEIALFPHLSEHIDESRIVDIYSVDGKSDFMPY